MMEQEGTIAAQPAHDPCTTHAAPDAGSPAFVDQFVAQQTAGENAFFLHGRQIYRNHVEDTHCANLDITYDLAV